MTSRQVLALVLVVTLVIMAVQPARAEALEPLMIVAIVGAGVVVLILALYVVVASVSESRHAAQAAPEDGMALVALNRATTETP